MQDENTEVWHIPQTGEIFVNYEDYLNRMDFYKQRRFNDQITGHSGLTFFEAFNSELTGGREVEATFPEALKGPILRKVQFQTVSRLDNLVDLIFDEFRHDYYPGEEVSVTLNGGDRVHGLVRDKTTFGPRILPDGSRTLPVTRYLVNIKDTDEETIVTDEHICRDRGVFTKAMLRSFIKKTVIREAWTGAPWLVKHDYANMYHIDTRVPPHLRYDMKLLERKQILAQKKCTGHEMNGHAQAGPVRLPELKPATKSHKAKQSQPGSKAPKWYLAESVSSINGTEQHERQARQPTPPPPPPSPPPKYPIEDLALPPKEGSLRPRLKFLCRDPPVKVEHALDEFQPFQDKINMVTVGAFLETWDTLNVYCEIFQLDSFTFDDFVEAMTVASATTRVQLYDEIHCSVLKILVDSEKEGGKVRITLPDLEDDESDEDDDDEDEEDEGDEDAESQTPEPEEKPKGRATRSSLAKLEAERLAAEAAAAEEEEIRQEQESRTRAEELMREFDWIDHLRKRDFGSGGWERIIVGLLHQLSKDARHKETCEELLTQLVSPDMEPTQEVVQQNYAKLDVNHRVMVLQILCLLTMQTKAVRGYMEDCSETMTKYRKDRIEWQRQKKQAIEEVRQLQEQRRELVPDVDPADEVDTSASKEDDETKMANADESRIEKEAGIEGAFKEANQAKGKRRGRPPLDKTKKREADAERERRIKEKPQEPVKLTPQQQKHYNKILKEIQKKEDIIKKCEEEVAVIENDLREADCPRTRVLGKDRFWNRYYWFERNGMPYGGLPTSSTASAEYANGCIWVQGPDDMEREGYIDGPPEAQMEYKAKFHMSVSERKAKEENGTSLFTARQWGYISEPEDVIALIKWLDPRGFNELKLRKELTNYKDRIVKHMQNRKTYLSGVGGDSGGGDEANKDEQTTKRISSRIRDKTPETPSYRCLRWENTMALDELGYLHSNPPPPPRARKQTKKREAQSEAAGRSSAKSRRRG
ncbi:hypothetical protein E4U43_005586 [Claviceps pusilla]|uniref:ITC1-subunit of Isw2 chromatin remodelling complex n=1 Tax=Claviceps pusilla TaxID=123648 RepID=A0A9P7NGP5_9HYPO|nr:hypothetical protein E4U43_005586 [Claviceps pusilla]